jgi:CheY-like chemotaxis protein
MEPIKKRILIVDDDYKSRKLLKDILEWKGYEVVVVEGGEEAIEYLSSDADFDLIITDMLMPFMSGIELADKLKAYKETKNIPILGISAHLSLKGDIEVDDFLNKPINVDALLQKLDSLL